MAGTNLRITGGEFRSRRIQAPDGPAMRPTTDRMREALFNILDHQLDWPNIRALDLFSGSGSLALECLSRGVREVTSLEKNRKLFQHLQKTRVTFRASNWTIQAADVLKWAQQNHDASWNLILLDPPYALEKKSLLVERLWPLVAEGGLVVVEHPTQEAIALSAQEAEVRTYGDSAFSLFRKTEND